MGDMQDCPSYLLDELKFPRSPATKLRDGLDSGSAPKRDDKVQGSPATRQDGKAMGGVANLRSRSRVGELKLKLPAAGALGVDVTWPLFGPRCPGSPGFACQRVWFSRGEGCRMLGRGGKIPPPRLMFLLRAHTP